MAKKARRVNIRMGERCCQFCVISLINFVFWAYITGLISQMFGEEKCYIPDVDMEKLVQNEIAEHYPEVQSFLMSKTNKSKAAKYCPWPPLAFEGRQPINRTAAPWDELENKYTFMKNGHYKPTDCIPNQKVAIIVFVYKDRDNEEQFQVLMNNLLPKLQRQKLEFSIFVTRQNPSDIPNRGLLFNIGFQQAMESGDFDCVILHDVDVIPEDDRNYYNCGPYPSHMAKRVEINNYELPHSCWIGGIVSMTVEQYRSINGWSNMYFGYGNNNDDLYRRITSKYDIIRTEDEYSYCSSTSNNKPEIKRDRCWMYEITSKTSTVDGLNSVQYEDLDKVINPLFTLLYVDCYSKKVREDYISKTRLFNYTAISRPPISLNSMMCAKLLNRTLNYNAKLYI